MTEHPRFTRLLEALEVALAERPATRGTQLTFDAQQREVIEYLRENTEAQLTLLLIA